MPLLVVAGFVFPLLWLFAIPTVLLSKDGQPCDPTAEYSGFGVVAEEVVFPLPAESWVKTDDRRYREVHPVTGQPAWHAGTDYSAAGGTPIVAVAAGKVVHAGPQGGLGNFVLVEHEFAEGMMQSGYAHIRDGGIRVQEGDVVAAGQVIGEVGSTGVSSGNHLHLEMRPNGATGGGTIDAHIWLGEQGAVELEAGDAILGETAGGSGLPPCEPMGGGLLSADAAGVVECAKEQLGKPYVWGAEGPDTFDCSGLVQFCFAAVGIELPRVADAQARAGEEVWTGTCSDIPLEQLMPADVIGLAKDHSYHQHVILYVGERRVIHAPSPGKFVEYQSVPGYWAPQKCSVRRFASAGEGAEGTEKLYTLAELQTIGEVKWQGKMFTYYSQQVLPGPGLKIPGRHVSADGYVSDGDGYIVLAAPRSISHGTVYPTPFGAPGKVYDTCASCKTTPLLHLDVYTK